MRRTALLAAALVLGAAPVSLAMLGDASFSESVPVRVPPAAGALDDDGRVVPPIPRTTPTHPTHPTHPTDPIREPAYGAGHDQGHGDDHGGDRPRATPTASADARPSGSDRHRTPRARDDRGGGDDRGRASVRRGGRGPGHS